MNIRETERGRMLGFFPAVVLLVWVRKGLRALAELSCRDAYERMKARDAQRWECATRCLRGNVLALTQLYRRSLKWSCSCYYSINQLVEHKLPNLLIFVVFDQTYSGQCLWVSTFYFILHITETKWKYLINNWLIAYRKSYCVSHRTAVRSIKLYLR